MTSTTSSTSSLNKYPHEWGEYPSLECRERYAKKIHRITWNPRMTWNFDFDLDDKKIVKKWYLTMNQQEIYIQIEWANGGKSMFNANNEQDENVEYEYLTPEEDIDGFSLDELYRFNDVYELTEIYSDDA
tara:strand:+ start:28 stop:417 length:390 start_codon:yes stop_codon:yes gene_type:complete